MIPHIIHYCWFGLSAKPDIVKKCIASWQKYMPDWEIREWNEANYNVNKIPYTKEAYEQKKWAFVVDFARFDILNLYGGIFLDTDVELLRRIPEEILELNSFTGYENGNKINPGLIYAAEPGQEMLLKIMMEYCEKKFNQNETICDIVTKVLVSSGLRKDGSLQLIENVKVFPADYFCGFDHETQHFIITSNTVSIHHYAASWAPWYRKVRFKVIKIIAGIIGPERYKRIKHKMLHDRRKKTIDGCDKKA